MESENWKTVQKKPKTTNSSTEKSINNTNRFPVKSNRGGDSSYKGKRPYVAIPDYKSAEEEEKFKALLKEIPHLKIPGHIRRIQMAINIDCLADKMLSDEWIEFQRQGWEYVKVVKPDDNADLLDEEECDLLSLDNKWGDFVLFKKAETKKNQQ